MTTISRNRYEKALKKVNDIRREYSLEHINLMRLEYQRTKDQNLKRYNSLYKQYNRKNETVIVYKNKQRRCAQGSPRPCTLGRPDEDEQDALRRNTSRRYRQEPTQWQPDEYLQEPTSEEDDFNIVEVVAEHQNQKCVNCKRIQCTNLTNMFG